jgi:hypothetical protein
MKYVFKCLTATNQMLKKRIRLSSSCMGWADSGPGILPPDIHPGLQPLHGMKDRVVPIERTLGLVPGT